MSLISDRVPSPDEFLGECFAFKREHRVYSRFMHDLVQGKLEPYQVVAHTA